MKEMVFLGQTITSTLIDLSNIEQFVPISFNCNYDVSSNKTVIIKLFFNVNVITTY